VIRQGVIFGLIVSPLAIAITLLILVNG